MGSDESLAEQRLCGVDIAFWNPTRSNGRGAERRVDNMGDLLGPLVVQLLLASQGRLALVDREISSRRLLTVGSILHYSADRDVIWGAGANGKALAATPEGIDLDIRAVRGPWTAAELSTRGYSVPNVYGDPALLLSRLIPQVPRFAELEGLRLVIPNRNELPAYRERELELARAGMTLLSPEAPLFLVMSAIAHAEFVIGSSLHAVVVADAYGVPTRMVQSAVEPEFKYIDYLLGSGRPRAVIARNVDEALHLGGHEAPDFDADALSGAFPWDLWDQDREVRTPYAGVFDASPEALCRWRGRATRTKQREELVESFVQTTRRALADRDSSAQTVGLLSGMRLLAIPDVPRVALPRDVAALTYAIDHDEMRSIHVLLERGRHEERAFIRAYRSLGQTALVSLDVELAQAVGPGTTLELAAGPWHRQPLQLFESNHGQVQLEIDFLAPTMSMTQADDMFVWVRDEDGERVLPVEAAEAIFADSVSGDRR